jgi:hypothetical protein
LSDGFDLIASLELRGDGSFHFVWTGCEGLIAKAEGQYVTEQAVVRLTPTSGAFREDPRTFARLMHRVRWGEVSTCCPTGGCSRLPMRSMPVESHGRGSSASSICGRAMSY